jgi:2'-5' RNA ligase
MDPDRVPPLLAALESVAARTPVFTLSLAGLGAFPSPAHAQVLWAGVTDGTPELERIAREIDEAFAALGVPREERSFSPHVTLARLGRRARPRSIEAQLGNAAGISGTQTVSELLLFESRPGPDGQQHLRLGAAPLRQP